MNGQRKILNSSKSGMLTGMVSRQEMQLLLHIMPAILLQHAMPAERALTVWLTAMNGWLVVLLTFRGLTKQKLKMMTALTALKTARAAQLNMVSANLQ